MKSTVTTVPITMLSDEDLILIERVHGHICPMVMLAARMAKKALLEKSSLPEGLPFGFYRGHGCAVDGIQIFSGCTWGNANLVLLRGRDHSLLFTVEDAHEGILMTPSPEILMRIRDASGAEREKLMDWLKTVPDDEIFQTEKISGMQPLTSFPGD